MEEYLRRSLEVETRVVAPNTLRTYNSMLNSYKNCCQRMVEKTGPFNPFPLTDAKVRVFIEWYRENNSKTTYGYIRQFITAFVFDLNKKEEFDFTKTPHFKAYLKGLKRIMLGGSSPNAKDYISPEILNLLAQKVNLDDPISIQLMAIYSLCYYGFLRISECLSLKRREMKIDANRRLVLLIPVSKTDQTGRRVSVYICNSLTNYSHFVWLTNWMNNRYFDPDQKVFNLEDRQVRYYLKIGLTSFGIDSKSFSTHSFRKGAAHQAVKLQIQDCQIKAMGRWASECYQVYTSVRMVEAGENITPHL